jgi:glycerol-3-phosphate acyltransferase PlsY
MTRFLWIIISYLLGSLPFGYLIGRLSGKNVLKIGWRKTSGSNVFKNVGKWQGILTGFLDIAKGYLAVYVSQKLGFSLEVQAASGVAAVIGHNWSIFLKFSGGRGIGTFFGGLLALSPLISGLSLAPFLLLAIIWNASIGTLLLLFFSIYLSAHFNRFQPAGFYTVLVLTPILIKRLSPIKEILKTEKPWPLFFNRLIFDNDETRLDLRIKKLYKKNPEKINRVLKTISSPVWLPPKIGWEAAKFGVKVARKPIQLLMGLTPEKVVTELGQAEIKKMLLQSCRKIVAHQEEINKINVWPVADKDTGYNLAATLLGIDGVISQREYKSISELAQDIKEAAMVNARGNAGMIFTGYLIRFLEQIKNLDKVDAVKLAFAMRKGTKAARHSIIKPSEGTILDVMKAAGRKVYEMAKTDEEKNIIKILEEAQRSGSIALEQTKEKMEILRHAGIPVRYSFPDKENKRSRTGKIERRTGSNG